MPISPSAAKARQLLEKVGTSRLKYFVATLHVCVCVCVCANRGTHKGRKVPMPWYGYGYHAVPVSTPVRAYDSCRSLKMKTSLTMLLFPSHSEP